MTIIFSEQDLISFGQYIVSDLRKDIYRDRFDIDGEELENRLAKVSSEDIGDWMTIMESSADDTR